jgi:hypothetical protein
LRIVDPERPAAYINFMGAIIQSFAGAVGSEPVPVIRLNVILIWSTRRRPLPEIPIKLLRNGYFLPNADRLSYIAVPSLRDSRPCQSGRCGFYRQSQWCGEMSAAVCPSGRAFGILLSFDQATLLRQDCGCMAFPRRRACPPAMPRIAIGACQWSGVAIVIASTSFNWRMWRKSLSVAGAYSPTRAPRHRRQTFSDIAVHIANMRDLRAASLFALSEER